MLHLVQRPGWPCNAESHIVGHSQSALSGTLVTYTTYTAHTQTTTQKSFTVHPAPGVGCWTLDDRVTPSRSLPLPQSEKAGTAVLLYLPCRQWLGTGQSTVPLLSVIAAQPMAVHLRLKTLAGLIRPIRRSGGSAGPPCHPHADDTTVHLMSREDLQAALETSIQPCCSESGSSPGRCQA